MPDALQITAHDIRSKKRIGQLEGADVWHLETKGGYHIVAAAKREGSKILGVGPHRAVARYTAEKHFPALRITELAKSDFGQLSREEMARGLAEARPLLAQIWAIENAAT